MAILLPGLPFTLPATPSSTCAKHKIGREIAAKDQVNWRTASADILAQAAESISRRYWTKAAGADRKGEWLVGRE
jgi:hypothetical protein